MDNYFYYLCCKRKKKGICCCKKEDKDKDKKKGTDNEHINDKQVKAQEIRRIKRQTYKNCISIIDDRLDLKNYIQDSMDLQIIRGLLLKARHKILMPILSIELANTERLKEKNMKKKNKGKYKSSFLRNIFQADDLPVFDVGSAVSQ